MIRGSFFFASCYFYLYAHYVIVLLYDVVFLALWNVRWNKYTRVLRLGFRTRGCAFSKYRWWQGILLQFDAGWGNILTIWHQIDYKSFITCWGSNFPRGFALGGFLVRSFCFPWSMTLLTEWNLVRLGWFFSANFLVFYVEKLQGKDLMAPESYYIL